MEVVIDYQSVEATARREIPASVSRVLQAAEKSIADLDGCYFTPITIPVESSIRADLKIPRDRFHAEISEFGNCASGIIPLAMIARGASRLRDGRHSSLLGGIGAGLAWASALVTTENLVCPDILEM